MNFLAPVSVRAEININLIYDYHNQERAKRELPELTINSKLVESATNKAKAMLDSNCWSHYCPDGKSPWDFFDDSGYTYVYAGENLAEGFTSTEKLMEAWMNSPTHRINIVNQNFTEIGIGYVVGDFQDIKNNMIIVVHFGSKVTYTPATNLPDTGSIDNNLVKFTYPTGSTHTNNNLIRITGSAPKDSKVAINMNGSYLDEVVVKDQVFSLMLKEPLSDGQYTIYAEAYEKNNTFLGSSRNITFTVDTVSPIADESLLTISEVLVTKSSRSAIINYDDDEIFTLTDKDNGTTSNRNAEGLFELIVCEEDIQNKEYITYEISDKAGNKVDFKVSSNKILSMLDKEQTPLLNQLQENIQQFSDFQNIKLSVNWGFVSFLTVLFGIDFFFVTKTGLSNTYRSKSHINLAIYLILIIVLIIGITSGDILNGSAL